MIIPSKEPSKPRQAVFIDCSIGIIPNDLARIKTIANNRQTNTDIVFQAGAGKTIFAMAFLTDNQLALIDGQGVFAEYNLPLDSSSMDKLANTIGKLTPGIHLPNGKLARHELTDDDYASFVAKASMPELVCKRCGSDDGKTISETTLALRTLCLTCGAKTAKIKANQQALVID